MKKIISFLIILSLIAVSMACQTSSTTTTTTQSTTYSVSIDPTIEELSTPEGVEVTENLFECLPVLHAVEYLVEVKTSSDEFIGLYTLSNQFDLSYLLDDGDYKLRVQSVVQIGPDNSLYYSDYSEVVQFTITDSKKNDEMRGSSMSNENYIRYLGRTHYNETTEATEMYYTGSGFEVGFYGTSLEATFLTTNPGIIAKEPYFVVFVDGELNPTLGTEYLMFAPEVAFTLASDLEEGYHTIRVVKRSEALDSDLSIKSITTDGSFAPPSEDKELKIQFIGASTMTGYGNMATSPSTSKTTLNSNGLLAYPALTSYMLNAEYSIVAASGWGISRGWNTGGAIDPIRNIPNAFDYLAINPSATILTDIPWNQSDFVPDIIVVSLGANDFNSTNYNSLSGSAQEDLVALFISEYTSFLLKLHGYFPEAIIICAYGILGTNTVLESSTDTVVNNIKETYDQVYTIKLTSGGTNDIPFGSDYHPSVGTHLIAADELVTFITDLTDYEKVNENVILD